VTRDFPLAEFDEFLRRGLIPVFQMDGREDLLAVFGIRNADDLNILHLGMREDKFFQLPGINIFAAPDNHILDPAGNFKIAVWVDLAQVPRVQPTVGINGGGRGFRHLVVAFHHAGAARDDFALGIRGQIFAAFWIDDFSFDVRQQTADRGHAQVHRIIAAGHGHDRRGFRLAERDDDFGTVHFRAHLIHGLYRAGRSGHNAGPQGRHVVAFEIGMMEHGDEHGRHAVDGRAFLFVNQLQRQKRVERLQKHHGGGVVNAVERAHDAPEAVKDGHLDEQRVLVRHPHDIADHAGVVDDIVMGQHHAFRKPRRSRRVLHIDDIVIGERFHPVVQILLRNALAHGDQIGKFEHARRAFPVPDIDNVFQHR